MSRAKSFERRLRSTTQPERVWYAQPLNKLFRLMKLMLVGGAVLGLVQPALAVGLEVTQAQRIFPTSGQGVYAALLDLDGSSPKPALAQRDDDAFSALAGFAQTVSVGSKTSGETAATPRQTGD